MRKIRVLVIDDSAVVREVLTRMLRKDDEIEVMGSVMDPLFAVQKIKESRPDVITLDVEMPRMDGLTFLRKLMSTYPIPVIMISSWTRSGSDATIKALEMGAVDFVAKPEAGLSQGLEEMGREIISKVKAAAGVNVRKLSRQARPRGPEEPAPAQAAGDAVSAPASKLLQQTTDRIIAVGASTGGTVAVRDIITRLPFDIEPVVVVLHMPSGFTASYARALDEAAQVKVQEVSQESVNLLRGHAYIATGGRHLLVSRSGAQYYARVSDDPPYNHHRPSVDRLFFSVAEAAGRNALGVILTGMGGDGAQGLKTIRDAGGHALAQDEETSIVFGMPRQALNLGAVNEMLPLDRIPQALVDWSRTPAG